MEGNFIKNKEQRQKSGGGFSSSSRFVNTNINDFESKLLNLSRVSHTRAGGRKMGFRAVMIVGDKKGKIGLGVAKGKDVALAVEKATRMAKKGMIKILIINDTILHEVQAKFGAAKVLLKPQKKGRGLVAGGTVRVICSLAGIKNISSKILNRTTNKLNNARATIAALKKLKDKIKNKNAVT